MRPLLPRSRFAAIRAGTVVLAGAAAIGAAASWSVSPVGDEYFRTPTPHEAQRLAIQRGPLARTRLGRAWLADARRALSEPLPVSYAHMEEGRFVRSGPEALGFRIPVSRGQRLEVRVDGPLRASGRLFVDLFRLPPDTAPGDLPVRVRSLLPREEGLEWEPETFVEVLVRVQPTLFAEGPYRIRVRRVAALEFPVAGRDQGSVLSPFGASREGGRRRHHGVDIFAPRGTPVVAAAEGVVRRADETRVGGRVVWLRDERRGQSLYYAHLDRYFVRRGQRVSDGDTIGLVGNTGNARTTPPHLHFGIYRRGSGPVDPLPFIRVLPSDPPPLRADAGVAGTWVTVRGEDVRVRAAPSLRAPVLTTVDGDHFLRVVGVTGGWYRVRLDDGTLGFLAEGVARTEGGVAQE